MIFSSSLFILFFCTFLVFIKFFPNYQKLIIILFSIFFYGFWEPKFVILIFYLILITFYCSKFKITNFISFILIIFPLVFFKYSGFIIESFGFNSLKNFNYEFELPLAISFITFTALAYIIDVKKKVFDYKINFFSFFEFIIYFPQLIAGPILRANELVPSLAKKIELNKGQFKLGMILFLIGFVKKVYFADNIALIIDPIFLQPNEVNPADLLKGFLLFPLQIYFDFSGYIDMALGISSILGIDLPINFNKPYLTKNLSEFWRNWHITLSRWFRDYLYIPLGGSKEGSFILFSSLILTMSLAGLWHGANYNFIIWGALNGFILFLEKKFGFLKIKNNFLSIFFNCFIVFNLWLIFRIQDLNNLLNYFYLFYSNIINFFDLNSLMLFSIVVFAVYLQKFDNFYFVKNNYAKIKMIYFFPFFFVIIILGLSFSSGTSEKFIYFNF